MGKDDSLAAPVHPHHRRRPHTGYREAPERRGIKSMLSRPRMYAKMPESMCPPARQPALRESSAVLQADSPIRLATATSDVSRLASPSHHERPEARSRKTAAICWIAARLYPGREPR